MVKKKEINRLVSWFIVELHLVVIFPQDVIDGYKYRENREGERIKAYK